MNLELLTYAPVSLADPIGSSPIVAAVQWLQQTVLGTVATTVAIMAIAKVGFMMMAGRIDYRRGLTVIVGCFVLFGASSIVAGIRATIDGGSIQGEFALAEAPSPLPAAQAQAQQRSTPGPAYDPYAGAAVPMR